MKQRGAAIGTFDGVHRGHLTVIDTLTKLCREKGLQPIALTFDRHPLELISPSKTPPYITTLEQKNRLLLRQGVTSVVHEFTEEFRKLTALEWMKKIHDEQNVVLLVIGYDNTFGCDGVNLSLADYKELGKKVGIEVVEAGRLPDVSSSSVRKAILAGNVEKAAEMLGRRYSMRGEVVKGNRLGRTLGYPTANIMPKKRVALPLRGTYAAEATLPDGKTYPAMVNIGTRPTLRRGDDLVVEAHLIGFEGDLYGKNLKLSFIRRLRDEHQFDSIADLRVQMEKDRREVMNSFSQPSN